MSLKLETTDFLPCARHYPLAFVPVKTDVVWRSEGHTHRGGFPSYTVDCKVFTDKGGRNYSLSVSGPFGGRSLSAPPAGHMWVALGMWLM